MTKQQRSVRVERFCIEVVRPGNSLSDAYRIAFQPKHCSLKTINEKASRLRKTGKVEARIKILMAPVIAEAQVSRIDWLKKAERYYFADVRKMFDVHGNVIDVPLLGENEAAMIAGLEIVEDFTKVKKVNGTEDAVPTGYTKKFKLVDPMKAHEYFGKVMGFIESDGGNTDDSKIPPRIQVILVDAPGGQAQVNVGQPRAKPKVHFVG